MFLYEGSKSITNAELPRSPFEFGDRSSEGLANKRSCKTHYVASKTAWVPRWPQYTILVECIVRMSVDSVIVNRLGGILGHIS